MTKEKVIAKFALGSDVIDESGDKARVICYGETALVVDYYNQYGTVCYKYEGIKCASLKPAPVDKWIIWYTPTNQPDDSLDVFQTEEEAWDYHDEMRLSSNYKVVKVQV